MNQVDEQTAEKQTAEEQQTADMTESEAAEPQAEAPEAEKSAAEEQQEQQPEQPALPGVVPEQTERLALLEAIVYVADEPLSAEQISEGLGFPLETVRADLNLLVESYKPESRGVEVRQVAGGFKMFTKAEHHDAVRKFVKSLRPKLKLSLPALETLAVVAYKQPITLPEIQAIRGVNASGVIHTLLKHKLIATAGRKKVVGKPMMYKTTREFLIQFGLNDLSELPNLKELEELSRAALGEEDEETREAPEGQGTPQGGEALEGDETSEGQAAGEAQGKGERQGIGDNAQEEESIANDETEEPVEEDGTEDDEEK